MSNARNIYTVGILLLLMGVCFGKNEFTSEKKEHKAEEVKEVYLHDYKNYLEKVKQHSSNHLEKLKNYRTTASTYNLEKIRRKFFLVFEQLKIECQ